MISGLIRYLRDPLHKNSLFLIGSYIAIAVLGFIFWIIAARLYTSEEVGLATALVSAILLLNILSKLGVDISLIRFLPNEVDKRGMINTSFTIVGLFSVALAIIFILGLRLWSPALLIIREKLSYSLLFVLFNVATTFVLLQQQGIFVALRATQFSFVIQVIAGLRLLLLVCAVSFGTYGIFSSWGLASCVAFAAGILFLMRLQPRYRPVPGIQKRLAGNMLHFSISNYLADSLKDLPGFILPLLIINILKPEMGAYFYIAWTIIGAILMIPYGTCFSLLAEGSYQPERLRSDVIRAMKFIFLLLIPAILLVFLLGDRLLSLFGREYSDNAFKLLWILALSGIPIAFNTLYITVKRVQQQFKPVLGIYAFIALFTIGASYALMKEEGLVGIGIAWTLGQAIVSLFLGAAILRRRVQGIRPSSR